MSRDLLINNARLIDGTGSPPIVGRSILVEDGRISRIDKEISADGVRKIDAAGATVLPGLIDAHVHLESVPGSYDRGDNDEQLWEFRKKQLRAYPACGVTTVLDCGISARQLGQYRQYVREGGVAPQIFALAPIFYPPGGYGDAVEMPQWGPFRSCGSAADVESLFEEYAGIDDIIGAKMTLEPGIGPWRVWPIHDAQMRRVISAAARERGMPLYVHALRPEEQMMALEMGAHCLVHGAFFRSSPTIEFFKEVKERGVYVTTTLASTLGQNMVMFDLKRLDDPLLELTVPEAQLATARDPNAWKRTMFRMFRVSAPGWMPDILIKLMLKLADLEKEFGGQLQSSSRAIAQMHGEGIPMVAGTDSANWPLFLNYFHGSSLILELEMLADAGLAPIDIISSATRIPAEMMGKGHEFGTVEVGKRADMVIVDGDPLADLRVLRKLDWSIKAGQARTPREWMEA